VVVLWVAVALVLVFAIAAGVVGREARRLDAVPPEPVFDVDEAVEYVADQLPFDVTAVLGFSDVRRIVDWHLQEVAAAAERDPTRLSVVGREETAAYVLERAAAAGADYTPAQVHAVVDAQFDYLEAIGAIGPPAEPGETGPESARG
jgi:hypothetical protein